jgi:hypothetical protein
MAAISPLLNRYKKEEQNKKNIITVLRHFANIYKTRRKKPFRHRSIYQQASELQHHCIDLLSLCVLHCVQLSECQPAA